MNIHGYAIRGEIYRFLKWCGQQGLAVESAVVSKAFKIIIV